MNEKIGVVILNYNSSKDTVNLVNSIQSLESNLIDIDIIIVDNNSNIKEKEILNNIENVNCIFLSENKGYAAGNNQAFKYLIENNYQYAVIANSDTVVIEKDTIQKMKFAIKQNNADVLGLRVLDNNGNDSAGAGYVNPFGIVKEKQVKDSINCQTIIGAFFMIKISALKKYGLINESFFLYLEETDFFINLYNKGAKILYYPYLSIIHYGGVTTSKVYDYYITRNRFLLVKRNFNTPKVLLILFLFIECCLRDIKQFFTYVIQGKKSDYFYKRKMRWLGFLDGINNITGKKCF